MINEDTTMIDEDEMSIEEQCARGIKERLALKKRLEDEYKVWCGHLNETNMNDDIPF